VRHGWTSPYGEGRSRYVALVKKAKLPQSYVAILYPYRLQGGGAQERPSVSIRSLCECEGCRKYKRVAKELGEDRVEGAAPSLLERPEAEKPEEDDEKDEILAEARRVPPCQNASSIAGYSITANGKDDCLVLSCQGPGSVRFGGIEFNGRLAWLRQVPGGDWRAFLVDARQLRKDDKTLLETSEPAKSIEIIVTGTQTEVAGHGLRGRARVLAPRTETLKLDGGDVPVKLEDGCAVLDFDGRKVPSPSEHACYEDPVDTETGKAGTLLAETFDGEETEWRPASRTARLSVSLCSDLTFGNSPGALVVRMMALPDGSIGAKHVFGATRRVQFRAARDSSVEFAYHVPRSEVPCQMTLSATDILDGTYAQTFTAERGAWQKQRIPLAALRHGESALVPGTRIASIGISLSLIVPTAQLEPNAEHRFTVDDLQIANPGKED
jgi:hypothetical protein